MSAGAAKAKQIGGVLLKVDGNRLQMITTATILLVCYFSSFYFYLSFLFSYVRCFLFSHCLESLIVGLQLLLLFYFLVLLFLDMQGLF